MLAGTQFGPLHSLLMNVTLANGWRTGLLLVFTPLLSDIPIIVLMLVILRALPPAFAPLLSLVGGLVMFAIAYSTFKTLRNPPPPLAPQAMTRQTLLKGVAVNFLNPGPYIYWGTISGPLFLQALNESIGTGVLFMVAFYGVFLSLMAAFVLLFDRLRALNPRVLLGMRYFSLLIMVYFGLRFVFEGISGLGA